jgi:O-antigen/teichoic acid export membrane protein
MQLKQFISSTAIISLEKITNIIFGIAVSVVVARTLGPQEFGTFSVILSISLMLHFVIGLGSDGLVIKDTINSINVASVYGSYLQLKLMGFCIYLAAFFIVARFIELPLYPYFFIITAATFFQVIIFLRYYFEAKKEFIIASVGVMLSRVVAISFLVTSLLLPHSFDTRFLVLYLVIDAGLSSLYFLYKYLKRENLKLVELSEVSMVAKRVAPYAMAAAIFPIFMQVDIVMIGLMLNESQAGFYSAANQMVIPFSFVGFILITVLFPLIIESKSRNNVKIMVAAASQTVILIAYAFVIFIYIFGDLIVSVLYGESYTETQGLLKIIVFVSIFAFSGSIYSRMLVYENYANFGIIKSLIGMVLNVLLNLLLIPKYGTYGAVYASIAAFAAADLILFLFNKRLRYIGVIGFKSLALYNLREIFKLKKILQS